MFKFSNVAKIFDEHLKSQLFWHADFIKYFLPEVASFFMQPESYVYDFGSSTGNVELALSDIINERKIIFKPIDNCLEMAERYRGKKERLIIDDFLKQKLEPFSFATSILALSFIHPSKRTCFIESMKLNCKKGGAIVILEKMINPGGYLGTVLNRITWKNKLDLGESLEMVINKELSLSGLQFPLNEDELEGFKLIWAYGDFRSYIWINGF